MLPTLPDNYCCVHYYLESSIVLTKNNNETEYTLLNLDVIEKRY